MWSIPNTAINNNASPSGIGGAGGGSLNYATNAFRTPYRLGIVQNFSCDLDLTTKNLHGGGVFPISVARGKGKIALKLEDARLNVRALNTLIFGDDTNDITTSGNLILEGETGTIPTTPFQITAANNATFARDL